MGGNAGATVANVDPNTLKITRGIGKKDVPELQQGTAKIVVTATRPSFLKLRELSSSTSRDFRVQLEPPRISVVSTKHYLNLGGSEMVVRTRRRRLMCNRACGSAISSIRDFPQLG